MDPIKKIIDIAVDADMDIEFRYSDNQPRDDHGRWTAGGTTNEPSGDKTKNIPTAMKIGFKDNIAKEFDLPRIPTGEDQGILMKVAPVASVKDGGHPSGDAGPHAAEALIEESLKSGISSKKAFEEGGHVSDVVKVVTKNGTVIFFKSAEGEPEDMRGNIEHGKQTEREVGAWQVAKIAGMEDLATPTKVVELDGKKGAALLGMPGKAAYAVGQSQMYDGNVNLARAAAYDYVIGNEDRHGKNWLVEVASDARPENAKLHLIDHGLSFPDGKFRGGNQEILQEASNRFDEVTKSVSYTPKDYAEPFMHNRDAIIGALRKTGLSDESIKGVNERITILGQTTRWNALPGFGW